MIRILVVLTAVAAAGFAAAAQTQAATQAPAQAPTAAQPHGQVAGAAAAQSTTAAAAPGGNGRVTTSQGQGASAPALGAPGPPASGGELTGAQRTAAIASANAAIARLQTVQGGFTQIAWNGTVASGQFFVARPGRIRFDYGPDSPIRSVISDGSTVRIRYRDTRKAPEGYPLRSTPLWLFLKRDVNLARDAAITRVRRVNGMVSITARDRSGQADGDLTLNFAETTMELRNWSVMDAQGYVTRIVLSDLRNVARLEPTTFVLQ
jgi:outer membrane lipoprotein-sorting protein